MAEKLKKKHCWGKARVTMSDGFIEIKERKLLATIGMLTMLAWPIGLFILLMIGQTYSGGIDSELMVVIGVVLSIPVLATLAIYRLPRAVRLYPEEQLAQQCRMLFGASLFNRWHDLSQGPPSVERSHIIVKTTDEEGGSGAVALLGCLFALIGPLGLLLSLALQQKREVRERVYVLTHDGAGLPLAVLEKRREIDRVIALYEAALVKAPSDLASGY